jgi:GxxExxY protein
LAFSQRKNSRFHDGSKRWSVIGARTDVVQAPRSMLIEAPSNDTTGEIIAAAIDVHRALGPGLLESTYSECLQCELATRKLRYVTQRTLPLPLVYKGRTLNTSYRVDLIVEDCVVVEVKSVAAILPVHRAQLATYLRLTGCPADS